MYAKSKLTCFVENDSDLVTSVLSSDDCKQLLADMQTSGILQNKDLMKDLIWRGEPAPSNHRPPDSRDIWNESDIIV